MNLNAILNESKRKIGGYDRQEYVTSQILNGTGICLDVGCATTKMRKVIQDKGFTHIGLDSRLCVDSVQATADILPIKSNSMDVVILSAVVSYIYEWKKAIAEIGRVLKNNGLFYFYDSVWRIYGQFVAIPKAQQKNIINFPNNDTHGYLQEIAVEEVVDVCSSVKLGLIRMDIRFDYMDGLLIFNKD